MAILAGRHYAGRNKLFTVTLAKKHTTAKLDVSDLALENPTPQG
jgi:hypothetical protein